MRAAFSPDGTRVVTASDTGYRLRMVGPTHRITRSVADVHPDQNTSKAVSTTTSDFASAGRADPSISCFLQTRLELLNGEDFTNWLVDVVRDLQ
jgi:hypothetical protein